MDVLGPIHHSPLTSSSTSITQPSTITIFSIKHHPNLKHQVSLVVTGDCGTGKLSLNAVAASERFLESVSLVLLPTRLPADYYPDAVPVTIIDTASRFGLYRGRIEASGCRLLTYACDKPETLSRLQTFWIPEVRRLKVKALVIVVGCKLDLHDEHYLVSLKKVIAPIMQQFREIKTVTKVGCDLFEFNKLWNRVMDRSAGTSPGRDARRPKTGAIGCRGGGFQVWVMLDGENGDGRGLGDRG
ncbi:putative small GTPase, P-loop containing nucleoside triphosphate hydrolase [Helianthus anomalus]